MKKKFFGIPEFIIVLSILLFIAVMWMFASNDMKRAQYNMERELKIKKLEYELKKTELEKYELACKLYGGKIKE